MTSLDARVQVLFKIQAVLSEATTLDSARQSVNKLIAEFIASLSELTPTNTFVAEDRDVKNQNKSSASPKKAETKPLKPPPVSHNAALNSPDETPAVRPSLRRAPGRNRVAASKPRKEDET